MADFCVVNFVGAKVQRAEHRGGNKVDQCRKLIELYTPMTQAITPLYMGTTLT